MDACVQMFTFIHQSVERKSIEFKDQLNRQNYVTPTSFLEQLSSYAVILRQKRKSISFSKGRLEKGLIVLEKAGVEIAALQEHINKMAPELAVTKKDVAATMANLAVEKADADQEKEIVAKDEAIASAQEEEADIMSKDAQRELNKATPLLEEAAKVLNELKKDDFYVLQGIKKPTPAVVLGMEVSCHMMGLKPKKKDINQIEGDTGGYFFTGKANLLNNPGKFMADMKEYDKEHIPEKTVKAVNAIITSEDFTMEKVKSASQALVAILKWSSAMMSYHELLKIVNPKRALVKEMNEKLTVVRKSLAEKRAKLKAVEEKIDSLERMFREKKELEEKLQKQIDDCMKKLDRANKIIAGLAGEKSSWNETVKKLTLQMENIIGNCLVAAGMMAYGGPFTAVFR